MMKKKITGLVAATQSPMHDDGSIALDQVGPIVEHLVQNGLGGIFVCGTTGEGPLLTSEERCQLAEAYVKAVAGRFPVIIQVGHNSVAEACSLAAHARQIGADAVSAVSPSYFRPTTVESLVQCLQPIAAAAGELPFYYYNIPSFTGVDLSMPDFLRLGATEIPTLTGIKFTHSDLMQFQQCLQFDGGAFDILFGIDENLLAGLSLGARGAVGSTYNFAAPIYHRVIQAFESGDMAAARTEQYKSVRMLDILFKYPFNAACKAVMGMLGINCGPVRPPLQQIQPEQRSALQGELESLGFFDWVRP